MGGGGYYSPDYLRATFKRVNFNFLIYNTGYMLVLVYCRSVMKFFFWKNQVRDLFFKLKHVIIEGEKTEGEIV